MNAGIDYGRGETNIDPNTGIRFGVISQHSLSPYLIGEEFQPEYGEPACPSCGNKAEEGDEADFQCLDCNQSFYSDEAYGDEPNGWSYGRNGYEASLDSTGDVWLFKSPYFTWAQFCSPCAPGAGHLDNPLDEREGAKTYCWGHAEFEGDKAPYPVYSVETGKEVLP